MLYGDDKRNLNNFRFCLPYTQSNFCVYRNLINKELVNTVLKNNVLSVCLLFLLNFALRLTLTLHRLGQSHFFN